MGPETGVAGAQVRPHPLFNVTNDLPGMLWLELTCGRRREPNLLDERVVGERERCSSYDTRGAILHYYRTGGLLGSFILFWLQCSCCKQCEEEHGGIMRHLPSLSPSIHDETRPACRYPRQPRVIGLHMMLACVVKQKASFIKWEPFPPLLCRDFIQILGIACLVSPCYSGPSILAVA